MNHEIYIRVDADASIGLGHLTRCIAFAEMVKYTFKVTFVCLNIPQTLHENLKNTNFKVLIIQSEKTFFELIKPQNIIVLDGYHFDTNYQRKIKEIGAKLVCIDDMHDKVYFADLIINHAPEIAISDYLAQPYTQYALGLDYALLRPLFLEQASKIRKIEKIESALICFGGSDPMNYTQSILKIVLEFSQLKKIIVITGSAFNSSAIFKQMISSDSRIDYRHSLNEKQMLDCMLLSDIAIVPSSGILFEVLAAGCIPISGSYIDNQNNILNGFQNIGAIIKIANLSNPRSTLLNLLIGKVPTYQSFIDGNSKSRILKKLNSL